MLDRQDNHVTRWSSAWLGAWSCWKQVSHSRNCSQRKAKICWVTCWEKRWMQFPRMQKRVQFELMEPPQEVIYLGAHRRIHHLFWECAGLSWSWNLMLPNAAIHSKSMQTWDSLARRKSFPKASWMCQQYVRWTTSLMFRWSFRFAWASCRRIVSKTVEDLADAVAVPATSSTSVTGPCISCFKSCVPNGKSLRWVDDIKPRKSSSEVNIISICLGWYNLQIHARQPGSYSQMMEMEIALV